MIAVLILTRSEELDLPGCLASVAWSDDTHVFDSYSTDATLEIARADGAKVHQRVFDDSRRIAMLRCGFPLLTHGRHSSMRTNDRQRSFASEMQAAVQRATPDGAP